MTYDRKCDSPKRGVKGDKVVRQLTERCDGYEGGVRGWRGVILMREV